SPVWPFDNYTVGVGRDNYTGYGRVNAFKAVSSLRYKQTLNNSPTGKSGLSAGDYVKIFDIAGHPIGRITINNNMIAPDGYWRWNGYLDNGIFNLAPGTYLAKKNSSGSTMQIGLFSDVTPPVPSQVSFSSNSRFKMNIQEYYNVVWISVFVFNSDGSFLRKDFENKISNSGSNKYFNLNSSLSNGQIIKIFLVDNAGNVNSISKQYTYQPLGLTISSIGNNQYHANVTGGASNYSDYTWWYRNDDGIIEKDGSKAPPVGVWLHNSYWDDKTTITYLPSYNWSLKCKVTDSDGSTAIDTYSGLSNKRKDSNNDQSDIPESVVLGENSPNPFNPTTQIKFGLPSQQKVAIDIYSITGQKIKTLVDNTMSAGYHTINWNATNANGAKVSSGVYIFQLRCGNEVFTKKMIFAK
ncbi:MAG: T9SS type A sorting domain-containing protein, partial [Bacillota bacterium]